MILIIIGDRVASDCIKAFQNGQKNSAEQLLPHVDSPDSVATVFSFRASRVSNVSLFHLAAHNGWNDIAALLVTSYHCDPNGIDANGNTPMHYATYNGHLGVVKYFIKELLCKPIDKNSHGSTQLHYACINGHDHVVQYLLSTGRVDPLAKDNDGYTPLEIIYTAVIIDNKANYLYLAIVV